jgi:hypothetical protein
MATVKNSKAEGLTKTYGKNFNLKKGADEASMRYITR